MTNNLNSTPAELGYRMPAEWYPHAATWMAWPGNRDTWPNNLAQAQSEYVRLVETIAKGETVCMIASGDDLAHARHGLKHITNIQYFDIATNDAWIRDYGPTFVVRGQDRSTAAINWTYNGWGKKYPPYDRDAAAAIRIAQAAGVKCFSTQYVVEGGALEINDRGDLLTSISCLLNFNRNPVPGQSDAESEVSESDFANHQADISRILAAMTGAASISWLSGAELAGDDTDGHVDQQIRFADSDSLIIAKGYDPEDPYQSGFELMIRELKEIFGGQNQSLQGMDLPLPPPITLHGKRIPASYLNFYVCNYGVIVPQFDAPLADARAIDLMKSAFPGRRIIGLPSLNLACGLGSFHCLTQQQPLISQH